MLSLVASIVALAAVAAQAADVCSFKPGDVFTGAYRKTLMVPELSASPVTVTFAPDSYVVETNKAGSVWSRWVSAGSDFVVVQSFAATGQATACPSFNVAKYQVKWDDACEAFTLEVVHDDCQVRTSLFTTMTLRKADGAALQASATAQQESSACATLLPGQTFSGIYPQRAERSELAGERVHVTVTPSGLMEVSSRGAFFVEHRQDGSDVHLNDVASHSPELACANEHSGTYTMTFSRQCDQVTLSAKGRDECASRQLRLDDLSLVRVTAENVRKLVAREPGNYMD